MFYTFLLQYPFLQIRKKIWANLGRGVRLRPPEQSLVRFGKASSTWLMLRKFPLRLMKYQVLSHKKFIRCRSFDGDCNFSTKFLNKGVVMVNFTRRNKKIRKINNFLIKIKKLNFGGRGVKWGAGWRGNMPWIR